MKSLKIKMMLQAAVYIILGILFITRPLFKTTLLVTVIGFMLLVLGIMALVDGLFVTKGGKEKIFRILEGAVIILFAYTFFINNPLRGAILLVYIAVWSLIFMSIGSTLMLLKADTAFKWVGIILNIFVIALGFSALFDPLLASKIFIFTIAFQLIFTGLNRFMLALALKDTPPTETVIE